MIQEQPVTEPVNSPPSAGLLYGSASLKAAYLPSGLLDLLMEPLAQHIDCGEAGAYTSSFEKKKTGIKWNPVV